MAKRRSTLTVFLDSSILFSAVNSPIGGSAKIFTEKSLTLVVSTLVLTEVERNIRDKLADYHLKRFFLLVERLIILNRIPNQRQIESAKKVIAEKDSIILASAKLAQTQTLLTLDQKHFLTPKVEEFIKPTKILTPKMFFAVKNSLP